MVYNVGFIIEVIIFLIGFLFIFWFLDRKQYKMLKDYNSKINSNPKYLNNERRQFLRNILNQTAYMGIFSAIESRKLRKKLDRYK